MPPKSTKERSREWRERIKKDPELWDAYKKKEKERYLRRKQTGSRKLVGDMSEREKRAQRKQWKQQKRNSRKVKKQYDDMTPPNSPPANEIRRNVGRKKIRRDRAKAYRKINVLKVKLENANRRIKRLQKRKERAAHKLPDTPRSKMKKTLNKHRVENPHVRKQLEFHAALVHDLREKHKQARTNKDKQIMSKVFSNGSLKKYRMLKKARLELGLSRKANKKMETRAHDNFKYERKLKCAGAKIAQEIQEFYERDDVSTQKPGVKDTITRNMDKKQRRTLNDTISNLHKKFLSETPYTRVSYATFARLRPFWVTKPGPSDRDTCLCRRHENIQLKTDTLESLGILNSKDPELVMNDITCNTLSKKCMYRECASCKDHRIDFKEFDPNEEASWDEWRLTDVQKKNKSTGEYESKRIVTKSRVHGTVGDLTESYEEEMNSRFLRHIFNIRHQYYHIRLLKYQLTQEDVLLHVDFSENWGCKYSAEIQSMHFGGSRNHVTLHTGVAYTKGRTIPFASVSESMRHDPAAIWAHIAPVLQYVSQEQPSITNVYFLSDGPTTQYRQKKNFYLLSLLPFQWGFSYSNWSFLEAGHGKGAADGIGGTLKRTADELVSHGTDIPDAATFYDMITSKTLVKLFSVKEEDIIAIDSIIPRDLQTVPHTMLLHQLISLEKHKVYVRVLSCFSCCHDGLCSCYEPAEHTFASPGTGHAANIAVGSNADQGSENGRYAREDNPVTIPSGVTYNHDLVGQWCIVTYDSKPYPGLIEDADEEAVFVSVLHRVGDNRFFTPPQKDVVWYSYDKILCLITEPSPVTKRHVQVDQAKWDKVCDYLKL